MKRNKLKAYAPQARRDFIKAVTDRAAYYGLTENKFEPITEQGDVAIIAGKAFPRIVAAKRKRLEERIRRRGFEQVLEAVAYTWFNRLVAIRFMELHGYLDHGYRVLSHPEGSTTPEIVEHAEHFDLPGLDREEVIELKLEGTKEAELYRMLLIAQCNALHKAMPFLFEWVDDETELLLPYNLLHSDSLIRKLVNEISEEEWKEVEIIGWLYQFYISEKKDEVIGKVVKSEDIPAATQLFTPNWIVKYLVQNSLGRQWVATYPNSTIKQQMEFYIEPAEQAPEVQKQLRAITPETLNPEELTLLDPACGSGHILVEAYDLLKAIYQELGYRAKDIPRLILEKNLYGLEIDDRAAQLAALVLMMKARADDRRIFESAVRPQVFAIQESKGLDVREITEAINSSLEQGEKKEQKREIAQTEVAHLIDLFEHGKTFGSLIRVPEASVEKLIDIAERLRKVLADGDMFAQAAARAFLPFAEQARLLAAKYDAVVANPPYMGSLYKALKTFATTHYPASKADLFSMFVERGFEFAANAGSNAMVTMHSWMFLSSFEALRSRLVSQKTIVTLAHLGPRAFGTISGEVVQTAAFSVFNQYVHGFKPTFFRLVAGEETQKKASLLRRENVYDSLCHDDFRKFPSCPIAYWASPDVLRAFEQGVRLGELCTPSVGLQTGDNANFIRAWYEPSIDQIGLDMLSPDAAEKSRLKWFPCNKGGPIRKWYGNHESIINWQDDGRDIRALVPRSVIRNPNTYFRPMGTWSRIATGSLKLRWVPNGFVHNDASCVIHGDEDIVFFAIGLLNSVVCQRIVTDFNPTINVLPGQIAEVPVVQDWRSLVPEVSNIVRECIDIAKRDWDTLETSWDFSNCPLLNQDTNKLSVTTSFADWMGHCKARIHRLRYLEERINHIFVSAYTLQNDLSPEVPENQITLYQPKREEEIKRLISYSIGCMMGRYSLDKPGLIYAHRGNKGFDPIQYRIFPADDDGIVPITDTDWFDDDAANRVVEFIGVAWPNEHLEQNLDFVAESLGQKRAESSRETVRRYLVSGFYKNHLSMYKKRPIYWLFSSGKQRAFQCLVYLHRYHEGTLARMRTEYVIPLQGKLSARIDQLGGDIAVATSTSHRKKLEREQDKLVKQQTELQTFDEKLRHYADQRISLDLDDGVKVNYGKFGDLLAEVKAVTGKSPD